MSLALALADYGYLSHLFVVHNEFVNCCFNVEHIIIVVVDVVVVIIVVVVVFGQKVNVLNHPGPQLLVGDKKLILEIRHFCIEHFRHTQVSVLEPIL
jgi:hypothetical protein